MNKITFFIRDDINECSASVFRLKHIISGFEGNNYETRIVSCYSPNRLGKVYRYFYIYLFSLFVRDDVFVYGELVLPRILGCFIMAKYVFAERTEFPFYKIAHLSWYKRIVSQCYTHTLKGVDTFITCSHVLKDYYQTYVTTGRVLVEPFFIDESFFDKNINAIDQHQLCYCGYMGNNKDGIEDLLLSFSIFISLSDDSRYRLVLLGSAEEQAMQHLASLTVDLGIEKNVFFLGKVSHNEVLETINRSGLLVLTRPDNLQAKGGFPSKLGEYMSTGNPVLCTDVGEIRQVVGDEIIQFVPAGDPEAIALAMREIFADYPKYSELSKKGREFVKRFVPQVIIRRILSAEK